MHNSLNRLFRLVWNHRLNIWCVAPETARSKGKTRSSGQTPGARHGSTPFKQLPLALMLGTNVAWAELPQGGQISAGDGSLSYQGNQLNVQQNSDRMALNWQSFSIGKDNKVVFNQPGAESIALNRVLGADVSRIQGAIKANGQVFLLNPNGVLFSPTAQVNTGGLVASTLELSNEDFMAGNFQFEGDSTAAVTNQGEINVAEGGTIALIAATIVNEGSLQATAGNVLMGAGRKVILDMGGPVKLRVDEGALNTLIEQGGAIRADGGKVLLTARAAGELATSVINHSGITQAQTLSTGENGEIVLLGDMQQGQLQVAGTLDASAPATTGQNGDGGFIETSAANVKINDAVQVTTKANNGTTGEWLIDPIDFTISDSSDPQTASGIGASTLSTQLAGSNITIETVDAGSEAGDIYVNAPVSWSADTTLSLNADNNILINAPITVENSGGGVALNYSGSHHQINAPISFTAGSGGNLSINGENFTLIHSITQLQNIDSDESGNYALANDIDASETNYWRCADTSYCGFMPLGSQQLFPTSNAFVLDGLGNQISNLFIFRTNQDYIGLFNSIHGTESVVRNLGLVDASIHGAKQTGILASNIAYGARVYNVHVSGYVSGDESVGGLVGLNSGTISDSSSAGQIAGEFNVGGLVGENYGFSAEYPVSITNSYATGSVSSGYYSTGGLVGLNFAVIMKSYATGNVDSSDKVGGLVGVNQSQIEQSFASGSVRGEEVVGGLVGYNGGGGSIRHSYSNSVLVLGESYVGGLVGENDALIYRSYSTSRVEKPLFRPTGDNMGGLVGGGHFDPGAEVSESYYSWLGETDSYTGNVYGTHRTLTELQQLSTFADWGSDISAQGGQDSVWRIYDSQTTPLLRAFLNPLTVRASDVSRNYDGTTSTSADSWTANIPYNTEHILGNANYSSGGINAGSYDLEVNGLYSDQLGYDLVFDSGTLTINKAQATVTANSRTTTYNGTEQSVSGFTASGLVNGEDASVLSGVTTNGGTGTNAGSYTLTASGSDGNYELTFVDGTLTIDKAPLTIAAQDASKTYDGLAYTGGNGVTYSGFVAGEDASILDGTLAYGGSAQGAVNAGDYSLSVSGLSADNYNINFVDGTLTIGKEVVDLLISAKDAFKLYDGEAWFGGNGIDIEGLAAGETLADLEGTLVWGGSAQGAVNAGDYTITASGLSSPNYDIRFNHGTLTIGQAPLTIAAQNASKTYDGQAWTGGNGVTYSGFVAGEDASILDGTLVYGGNAQGAVNAGDYTLSLSGLSADNYAINYVDGTLTIGKGAVDLLISAKDAFKVYDGEAWFGGNGISIEGLADGDTLADLNGMLVWGGTAQGAINAGEYSLTATGLSSPNYEIRFDNGTLTIGKADLQVNVVDAAKVYDAQAWSGGNGVSYDGFVGGEDASLLGGSLQWGGSAQGAVNAGDYALSVSGLSSDNYNLSYQDGVLTVDKAGLTVNVQDAAKTYDGLAWSGGNGVTYDGFVGGESTDVLSGELSWGGTAQNAVNAGDYTLSASGLSADNYSIAYVDGTLTVDKADLTVTANDALWVQDGSAWAGGNGVTYSGFVAGDDVSQLGGTLEWGGTAQGARNPGDYTLAASGLSADNYRLSYVDGQLQIISPMGAAGLPYRRAVQHAQRQTTQGYPRPEYVHAELKVVGNGIRVQ